jgi:hypothetical protein
MPAKLESSSAIDREGTGESPVAGSTFTLVDPIPRGAAWQWDWMREHWQFNGGRPRCPRCLKSNAVDFNGYNSRIAGSFHCNRCKTCWPDIRRTLCYICDQPFDIPTNDGSCYHINRCEHPFCPRCEHMIGGDVQHGRRQLRRIAGLR